jgi:NADH dehydrogenase (ubiquinone) 1 alpha subcomplex subunit 6
MALTTVRPAADLNVALRKRVLELYRRMCRQAEVVTVLYNLELKPSEIRHLVNLQFKKHAHVQDPRVLDLLLVKGEMELEETLKQWKQRPHVLQALDAGVHAPGVSAEVVKSQSLLVELLRRAEKAAGVKHDAERAAKVASVAAAAPLAAAGGRGAPRADQTMPVALPGLRELMDDVARGEDAWNLAQRVAVGAKQGQDALPVYVPGPYDASQVPTWMRELGEDLETLEFRDQNILTALARSTVTTKALDDVARSIYGDPTRGLRDPASATAEAHLPIWVSSKVFTEFQEPFSETRGLYGDEPGDAEAAAQLAKEDAQDRDDYQGLLADLRAYQAFFDAKKAAAGIQTSFPSRTRDGEHRA